MLFAPAPKHLKDGADAEQIAATFLQKKGLKLIEKNFRCTHGEIDLIMQDGKNLVFIEVRLRTQNNFGGAGASITPAKQQKLTRTAQRYLQIHGERPCRFDAILMHSTEINAVEWIQNAF
ncbi:MAG: YraN family protein [Methylotenera sp.]|nr:YraN family protein [Methylotenera sp.]